jgi:DNA-binding MarR family transcriptional regulator
MKNFRPNELIAEHKSVFQQAHDPSHFSPRLSNFSADYHDAIAPTSDQLIGLAKRLYTARSKRKEFVNPELFGEPGWDMLLALFNAETTGHKLTVSSICIASQCPDTTALRWLERLGQLDLVRREKSHFDGRVFFIELQPSARIAINNYLREIWYSFFARD